MKSPARREQRRIDTACWYAVGCYVCVTAAWVSMLVSLNLSYLFLITAGFAGLSALLRAVQLPTGFYLIPAATLIWIGQCTVVLWAMPGFSARILIAVTGILYSGALLKPMQQLWRNNYAPQRPAWLCKDCGYPLYGLTGPRCPECGRRFDPEAVPKAPPPDP